MLFNSQRYWYQLNNNYKNKVTIVISIINYMNLDNKIVLNIKQRVMFKSNIILWSTFINIIKFIKDKSIFDIVVGHMTF